MKGKRKSTNVSKKEEKKLLVLSPVRSVRIYCACSGSAGNFGGEANF